MLYGSGFFLAWPAPTPVPALTGTSLLVSKRTSKPRVALHQKLRGKESANRFGRVCFIAMVETTSAAHLHLPFEKDLVYISAPTSGRNRAAEHCLLAKRLFMTS